ncbi:NCOA5 protein, partial [Crocuta crocuta]
SSSIKELQQNVADYSKRNEENHERYQSIQLGDANSRNTWKEELFQHFYQVVQKERDQERPSDCVIVSINNKQRDYATGIGHQLQDHGLMVEMIHLSSESSLPRALQEVKDDGSPFCILVEQSNVKLSSCTVIILDESIKIHRHMPLEDALVLVAKEYRRFLSKREQQERAEIALRAGDLLDDFLARERLPSYSVPSGIQHLVFLLTEGKHLHGNELNLLIDYLKTRKGHLEGFETPESSAGNDHPSFPGRSTPVVGKPPPLLPTPGKGSFSGPHPPLSVKSPLLGDRPGGALLPLPGQCVPLGMRDIGPVWAPPPREDLVELGGAEVCACGRYFRLSPLTVIEEKSLWGEQLEPGSPCVFLFMFWVLFSAGLVSPKALFGPPLLPAARSGRPGPQGRPHPKRGKRPLLGEKPGLLAPP